MKYVILALALSLALVPGVLADSQLLYDERGDFAVGIQDITTIDNGERGRITSLVFTTTKQQRESWRAYDVILEVGRVQGDYYTNHGQKLSQRISLHRLNVNDNTVTMEFVRSPLSVTSFDDNQVVSISLLRQNKVVAHASGVFDLSDFS